MISVQLLVSEDGAASWRMNRRLKGIACTNILPPVQKSAEFQKRSLQVSEDLNKISPSSEILLELVESFESPSVCLHRLHDGGKQRLGGDEIEWMLQGLLDRLPFDGQLLEQLWIDEMAIRSEGMSSPHHLLYRASEDIRWERSRETSSAQWDPGKGGKFTTIQLWINRPLVSSPKTINADDRVGLGRGGGEGVDRGTEHDEAMSPLGCRGPTGIN